MKIFLAHPLRNTAPEYTERISEQVAHWESLGHEVHYPWRDTPQAETEMKICNANLKAIREADEVRVIWDGESKGVLFDVGMAYALGKRICPVIGYFPNSTKHKSFQNLLYMLRESPAS
jgi:nucleoside 2-deoxyribosyltransferase